MKQLLSFLLFFCLSFAFFGCNDDEESFKLTYPEEKQDPFVRENVLGHLKYSNEHNKWVIQLLPEDNSGFPQGVESAPVFLVTNINESMKTLEGDILFDGTFLYLYYAALLPSDDMNVGWYVYSLEIRKIQKYEKQEK